MQGETRRRNATEERCPHKKMTGREAPTTGENEKRANRGFLKKKNTHTHTHLTIARSSLTIARRGSGKREKKGHLPFLEREEVSFERDIIM